MPSTVTTQKKDIIKTEEDEENYRNNNICRFSEHEIFDDKIRDHCLLTGNYKGPTHQICNINVTQKHSILSPIVFHNFSNYDYPFFKKLFDEKNKN